MKRLLTILTLAITFVACNTQSKEAEEKPLMEQVMDVHDAVMPKMGDLMKTKKRLLAKANAMMSTDSAMATNLQMLAEEVDLANESMMDWMRNFDPNFTGTEDEVKSYLTKKKEGIEKVAKAMNSKLAEGKEALK